MDKIKFQWSGIWYLGDKQAFDVLCRLAPRDREATGELLARFIRDGRVEEV